MGQITLIHIEKLKIPKSQNSDLNCLELARRNLVGDEPSLIMRCQSSREQYEFFIGFNVMAQRTSLVMVFC